MLIKEAILHLMTTAYVITSPDYDMENMYLDYYTLVNSNCNLKDVNITKIYASVVECASLCMHTSSCTGFLERHDECCMLGKCQPRCRPSTWLEDAEEIWDIYRQDGKNKHKVKVCSSYECFILRAMRLSNKLLGQGYVKERLKSSLRKFYGRYGDLTKQYEVPLSRMLHDILDDDHIQ